MKKLIVILIFLILTGFTQQVWFNEPYKKAIKRVTIELLLEFEEEKKQDELIIFRRSNVNEIVVLDTINIKYAVEPTFHEFLEWLKYKNEQLK